MHDYSKHGFATHHRFGGKRRFENERIRSNSCSEKYELLSPLFCKMTKTDKNCFVSHFPLSPYRKETKNSVSDFAPTFGKYTVQREEQRRTNIPSGSEGRSISRWHKTDGIWVMTEHEPSLQKKYHHHDLLFQFLHRLLCATCQAIRAKKQNERTKWSTLIHPSDIELSRKLSVLSNLQRFDLQHRRCWVPQPERLHYYLDVF